jgi:hypothetical protein
MKPKPSHHSRRRIYNQQPMVSLSPSTAVECGPRRLSRLSKRQYQYVNQQIALLRNEIIQTRQQIDYIQSQLSNIGVNINRLDAPGLKGLSYLGRFLYLLLTPIRWIAHLLTWFISRIIYFLWKSLYGFCFTCVLLRAGAWRKTIKMFRNHLRRCIIHDNISD